MSDRRASWGQRGGGCPSVSTLIVRAGNAVRQVCWEENAAGPPSHTFPGHWGTGWQQHTPATALTSFQRPHPAPRLWAEDPARGEHRPGGLWDRSELVRRAAGASPQPGLPSVPDSLGGGPRSPRVDAKARCSLFPAPAPWLAFPGLVSLDSGSGYPSGIAPQSLRPEKDPLRAHAASSCLWLGSRGLASHTHCTGHGDTEV